MKPMKPMTPMDPIGHGSQSAESWWPHDLGKPSVSGSSNALRYVYFADKHRLAVDDGEGVKVYDTGDTRLNGFKSVDGKTLTFETQAGAATLASLKLL